MTDEDPRGIARRKLLQYTAVGAAMPALLGGPLARAALAATDDGLPDYLPVPAGAHGPNVNELGYYVGRIKGNLYWITDSNFQCMFLTTRTGVVLVDAPPSIGGNLQRAIDEVTRANGRPNRVTHLVYSHFHADHIGGAGLFPKAERIAHTETRRLLKALRDPRRPLPTVTFDDQYILEVGGERLELRYHGPNHSPDNIFIWAPNQETLMVVDVVFPGWTPFLDLAVAEDVPAWVRAHDTVLKYPWKTLVGGHKGRLGVRADAELQRGYVHDLETSARAALAGVDFTPFYMRYAAVDGNMWATMNEYLKATARVTLDSVVAKYAGKLAAVDVFAPSHAMAMVMSLRLDLGVDSPGGGTIHP
ncbi:MBL fold metallo-hydrolase [Lentzea tibetensis]|uniref:MBL fold metallo-hydrolase n=1 Tax=Lentzea tibetensis TaxID=2591470 RepID=A0A563EEQ4_9PSEU|nr:MBL fold metallo-hydrolase [Lentzea tibetensis]TWP43309.1 MBL fold metallo-hydrolase [Lentzea tibetensis]